MAAAAYRAGQRLAEGGDDKAGLSTAFNDGDDAPKAQQKPPTHDYRRRSGVMSSFIVAPRDAPNWMSDRGSLWRGAW